MTSMRVVACLAAVVGGLVACESSTDATVEYSATLSGANERPDPVTTTGTGTFDATITDGNRLAYTVSFSGLTSNSIGAHIHGPADANGNASVILNFNEIPVALGTGSITLGATSGTGSGSISLSANVTSTISGDSLRKLFDAGMVYVNVHTVNNGGGEIRGQITRE